MRVRRSRAWCRAEVMSCWAHNGVGSMYVFSDRLRPFPSGRGRTSSLDLDASVVDGNLLEALDVFHGELTCCRLGHPNGEPCDREALM